MGKETKRVLLQIALFVITFITTTIAGCEWVYGKSVFAIDEKKSLILNQAFSWSDFVNGMNFSVPLLLILTVHEFGHYFMALYHRIKTSLPYYIPIPPIPFMFSFGTFGAVIRLREKPRTTEQTFDIGLAGPIAGFVVAVFLLIYGFATLPPVEYVYQFHPEYEKYGVKYADHVYDYDYLSKHLPKDQEVIDIKIGKSLIFLIAEQFVDDPSRIPNPREFMHYPLLFAVFFALFVTSLNLLPIGQLDGGHVVYGLFGYKTHKIIASVFFVGLMFYASLGNPFVHLGMQSWDLLSWTLIAVALLYFAFLSLRMSRTNTIMLTLIFVLGQFLFMLFLPGIKGYTGWLLLGLLLAKLVGIQHPPSELEHPLDSKRILLGWFSLIIFILCFSPSPLEVEIISAK
jgi:membrane-associated protease RseP (regulator of RpoE activity)